MFKHTVLFTIGLIGAVLFAQFPAFFDQYVQRLGGAITESQRQVTNITNIAASVGKTPRELIDELLWEDGRDAAIGRNYADTFQRYEDLRTARGHLRAAPVWGRTVALARYGEADLLKGTWIDYAPSVPVTWAGFVYAIIGFLFAGVLYETILWLLWLPFGARVRRV